MLFTVLFEQTNMSVDASNIEEPANPALRFKQ